MSAEAHRAPSVPATPDEPALGERSDGVLRTGPVDDPARYEVAAVDLDRASAGGEGLVCRARHAATGEAVALKLLTATSIDDFPRLAERAALLEDVRHPNLMEQRETFVGCALTEVPSADPSDFDVGYAVAGWVDGVPLADAAPAASTTRKLRWIAELADALDHLHGVRNEAAPSGLVHRDVKPSNVRIRRDGSAVLLDFGVARPAGDDDLTQGVGTYRWRAPEVLSGRNLDGKPADVWGLGAVAHWLLVGEPPALDGADAARERIAAAGRATAHGAAVARLVAPLLASDPARRPEDLAAWGRRLRKLASRRVDRRGRRSAAVRVVAGVGAGALVVAVLTGGDPVGTGPAAVVAGTSTSRPRPTPVVAPLLHLVPPPGPEEVVRIIRSPAPWRGWGMNLHFAGGRERLVDVQVQAGANFSGGEPVQLGERVALRRGDRSGYAVVDDVGATWSVFDGAHSATMDRAAIDRVLEEFLATADLSGTMPEPGPGFEPVDLLRVRPDWSVRAGQLLLDGWEDRTTEVASLPGRRITVHGQPAVVNHLRLFWRPNGATIVGLAVTESDPAEPGLTDEKVAERTRLAESLVEVAEADFERLPAVPD